MAAQAEPGSTQPVDAGAESGFQSKQLPKTHRFPDFDSAPGIPALAATAFDYKKVFVTLECLYGFTPAKTDGLKRLVKI